MCKEGEVYWDNTFEQEAVVVDVEGDVLKIDDDIGGDDYREYPKDAMKHNISVGRFEKIDETDVESEDEQREGIFDF